MELVFHGGKCCGIKTIYGFSHPRDITAGRSKITPSRNNDKNGQHVSSDLAFFTDEAPKETYAERFKRLVEFCKRERPHGLIEVALASISLYHYDPETGSQTVDQRVAWEPILFELGFVATTTFKNSNTNRNITVYHLAY